MMGGLLFCSAYADSRDEARRVSRCASLQKIPNDWHQNTGSKRSNREWFTSSKVVEKLKIAPLSGAGMLHLRELQVLR